MIAVLALPVILLGGAGFFAGAALARYRRARLALILAGAAAALAVILLIYATVQSEYDAIGTRILALTFVVPAALGLGLGAWQGGRRP